MASQGLTMGDPEEPPPDPYTQERMLQTAPHVTKTPPADDKLRRFLEYDGKILRCASKNLYHVFFYLLKFLYADLKQYGMIGTLNMGKFANTRFYTF